MKLIYIQGDINNYFRKIYSILYALQGARIYLDPSKSKFIKKSIKYLGFLST